MCWFFLGQSTLPQGILFRPQPAEQGATCSPLDHNAGEARRRERVCFPGGFRYKLQSCIDVRVYSSVQYFVSLVDSPSISLAAQARVTKGVLNEREVLLGFVSLVYSLFKFKQI